MPKKPFLLIVVPAGTPDDEFFMAIARQVQQMAVNANSLLFPRDTIGYEAIYADPASLDFCVLRVGDRQSAAQELDGIMAAAKERDLELLCVAYDAEFKWDNDGEVVGAGLAKYVQEKLERPIQSAQIWPKMGMVESMPPVPISRIYYHMIIPFEGVAGAPLPRAV